MEQIPLDSITDTAFPRDRTALSADALDELQASILKNGLRLPIEVYATGAGYALISGYRRLFIFRRLYEEHGLKAYATIPALLRTPEDRAQALTQMVEENDVREDPSPWEQAHVVVAAVENGFFTTLDEAISRLYGHANRQKRARIRQNCDVVEALDHCLRTPEDLSGRKLTRIGNCLRLGWEELILTALQERDETDQRDDWQVIEPILREAEALPPNASARMNKPRRLCRPAKGVILRRERAHNGYVLYITGRRANDAIMNEVIDQIEQNLSGY
jgi:ParB family chromosome partitioning protein